MIEVFATDRGPRIARATDLRTLRKHGRRVWVDLTDPTKDEVALVKDVFSLHPITAEDILVTNTRVKLEQFESYIFIVLYGIYKQKNIRLREIDFVLGKDFLITAHKMPIEGFEKLKEGEKRLHSLLSSGTDFLLHNLIDVEVDNFIPMLEVFGDVIDQIEYSLQKGPQKETVRKILDLRRRINRIKKVILPQQEKISFLAKNKYDLISRECQTYFRDVHDHFHTVADMIEDFRDTLAGSFDVYISSVYNDSNDVIKVLSIMATIMLPLTVISGVYGMNVLLPGAESPLAFWGITLGMVLLIAVMLGIFRKKAWL